jgi:hypothetical protein
MDGKVQLGNGKEVKVYQHGQAFVHKLELKDALYVPSFSLSLVSVSKLDAPGISTIFDANSCQIYHTAIKEPIITTVPTNGLYYINNNTPFSLAAAPAKPPQE